MIYVSVDFICAIWSDICELSIESFCFAISVMAVLVPKQMLLFCCVVGFCLIALLWYRAGSVDCVCDQFYQDVVSRCVFVFMYLFV